MKSDPSPGTAGVHLSRRTILGAIGMAATMQAGRANAMRNLLAASVEPVWHSFNLSAVRYLTLPARVNDMTITAVVDSGATRSVIKDQLALDLQLPYLGATLAGTLTQDISGSLYRVADLVIDGAAFHHIDVAAFDVSEVETIAGHVPFVIGQDLLRQIALEVQFTQNRLRLLDRQAARTLPGYKRLELKGAGREFPALPVHIENHGTEYGIMDLGSSVPLSMSRDYATQVGLLKGRPLSTTMTLGVEGSSVSQIFTARNVRVGPYTLFDVPVCVVEDWRLAQPIDLGWPLLAAFDTVFDLGDDALWLKGDAVRIAQPFPHDRSGLGGQRRTGEILVRHVALNSPAWHAGLREGDRIVAIDGRAIDPLYPPPGDRMGQKPAGTQFHLTLADRRDLTLTLADYF